MLPKIKAEGNIENMQAAAIGSGMMKEESRKEVIGGWLKLINGNQPKKKMTPDQVKFVMASMGIGITCPKA